MKTTAAVCALLGACAVTAAPSKRDPTTSEFNVRGFSANTTPHGTGAYISFHVEIPGGAGTECTYADHSSAFRLPDVAMRPCDGDAAFAWQFRQFPSRPGADGDYLLLVTHAEGSEGKKVAGYKEWPAANFPVEQYGASVAQFFRGDPDFVISNVA